MNNLDKKAIGKSAVSEYKKSQALDVILKILHEEDRHAVSEGNKAKQYLQMVQDDAGEVNMERHDKRFHGGHFDEGTMTCKLRDDLAKSDNPDKVVAEHDRLMSGISNSKASEYLRMMAKKCPNLDPEDTLEKIASIEDKKIQGDAFRWLMKGKVKLPEDLYKVKDARALADKAKKDPFSYDTPQDCINELQGNFKRGAASGVNPIDPDTVPELSDKQVLPMGVTTYLVQDDRNGQEAMRKIINTHWGEDANPWCLLHGDGKGNLSDGSDDGYDAWDYWKQYSALPKRVAFKDGKLLAFFATEKEEEDQWWDRTNAASEGVPLGQFPVSNDKMGRMQKMMVVGKKVMPYGNMFIGEEDKPGYTEWDDENREVKKILNDGTVKQIQYDSTGSIEFTHLGIPIDKENSNYVQFNKDGIIDKATYTTPGSGEQISVTWKNGVVKKIVLGERWEYEYIFESKCKVIEDRKDMSTYLFSPDWRLERFWSISEVELENYEKQAMVAEKLKRAFMNIDRSKIVNQIKRYGEKVREKYMQE